ncbi:MAG: hypothetical protein LBN00_10590 [Oscillospiraceae bacterium]|jgi:hypothetical protein|nr:hypothetical protein [Oscillospiraceae bacterium]
MKIELDKAVVTLTPENQNEKAQLEHLWRLLIDCNGPTLNLTPIGEYVPLKNGNGAQFYIEGLLHEDKTGAKIVSAPYVAVYAAEDCTVYCATCNKIIDLKRGDEIPLCCGKLMEIID